MLLVCGESELSLPYTGANTVRKPTEARLPPHGALRSFAAGAAGSGSSTSAGDSAPLSLPMIFPISHGEVSKNVVPFADPLSTQRRQTTVVVSGSEKLKTNRTVQDYLINRGTTNRWHAVVSPMRVRSDPIHRNAMEPPPSSC